MKSDAKSDAALPTFVQRTRMRVPIIPSRKKRSIAGDRPVFLAGGFPSRKCRQSRCTRRYLRSSPTRAGGRANLRWPKRQERRRQLAREGAMVCVVRKVGRLEKRARRRPRKASDQVSFGKRRHRVFPRTLSLDSAVRGGTSPPSTAKDTSAVLRCECTQRNQPPATWRSATQWQSVRGPSMQHSLSRPLRRRHGAIQPQTKSPRTNDFLTAAHASMARKHV